MYGTNKKIFKCHKYFQRKTLWMVKMNMWEKKYPAYIVNKCVAPFQDTIFLVNEMNMNHHMDKNYNSTFY